MNNQDVNDEMRARVDRGCDPLTGRPMVVRGPVRWDPCGDGLIDETGRAVVLTDAGDYRFASPINHARPGGC